MKLIEFNIYDEKYKNINDFENNFFFYLIIFATSIESNHCLATFFFYQQKIFKLEIYEICFA